MKSVKSMLAGVLLTFIILPASAQVTDSQKLLTSFSKDSIEGWKLGGVTSLTTAQTALVNWAAGGENSFSLNAMFSAFANYKKGKNIWDNSLDMSYGFLNQKNDGYKKTDDRFEITSKYGREAFKDFYYSALLNFKTQFSEGLDYDKDPHERISNLMAPGYLLGAVGLTYQPNQYFNVFFSPASGRLTMVLDNYLSDIGAFGVDPGKHTYFEFGGYIRTIFTKNDFQSELLKNVSFTSKLDLFSNYLKDPQNIDVNWEVLVMLKVNKFLTVNLNTILIYDADTKFDTNKNGIIDDNDKSKVQFKEVLGIGFSYKF